MDIRRVSPYPDHCTVTLDIPWEVAEALVLAGPSLISTLREAVKQEKQRVDANDKLSKYQDQKAETPQQEWQALARVADKRIRQLMREDKVTFPKAVSITAKEYHFPPSSMQALIANYRKTVKAETAQSRDTEVIRLYFRGLSNRIIADHLNITQRTVQRVLSDHKDVIKFVRNQPEENNSEPSRTSRKEQKERTVRRNAEILEQHLQGVPAHKLSQLFKLKIRSIQRIIKNCDTPSSVLNRHEEIERRKENHRKIGIQLYRQYRRIRPSSNEARSIFKSMSELHELSDVYIEHLIQARRNLIKAYINKRRLATILRLKAKNHKNANIAPILCLHEKTIARILREHKAAQIQGEAS